MLPIEFKITDEYGESAISLRDAGSMVTDESSAKLQISEVKKSAADGTWQKKEPFTQ